MMRWAMAAMILLAGAVAAPSQNNAQPQQAQQQPNPEGWAYKLLAVDGKTVTGHDFGTVPMGAQLHHSFKITNIWNVPIKIHTQVSCDCVKVTPSKPVLNKMEAGTLDIDMDGRRFQGAKQVNVFVTIVDDSPRPQYTSTATLLITATSRTDVKLNPGAVAFGIVPRGQVAQQFIDIDYEGRQTDWGIVQVPKSDLFDISVKERIRAQGRIGYQVGLTLKADAAPGTYAQDLAITTNDPSSQTLLIPFQITVQPRLLVSPSPIRMPATRVGGEVTTTVLVQGPGKAFQITGVEGLGDGLTLARDPQGARPVHYLTFKLNPTQAGQISRKLTVKTDGDKDLTATVTVEAAVAQ
jgi:hypothetical protein